MDYPLSLLPKPEYKLLECNLKKFCLIRHTHILQENLLNENGELTNEAIVAGAEKYLPDLSTSLFGVFKLEDRAIKVINNDFQSYCPPDYPSIIPVYKKDFELVNNRGYWSIMIGAINDIEISFEDNSLNATCKVLHTPMKWNFWHFSVNWYIDEIDDFWHNQTNFHSKSIRRKLISEARGLLKHFAKPNILSNSIIAEHCYNK